MKKVLISVIVSVMITIMLPLAIAEVFVPDENAASSEPAASASA